MDNNNMADKNGELSTICQENDVSQTSVTCTNHNDKNIFQETVELHQKKLKTKKRKLEPSKEKSQLDDSKGIGKVKDACVLVNDAEENDETSDRSTTVIDGGMINFPISPMHTHLICRLCNGYFRDPYTIPECLHTFCKSCLFLGFQQGIHHCPECKTSLSPDPYKEVLSDRTMQELVNKIFPSLKKNNDIEENIFYSKLGIKMKKEYREESANMSKSTRNAKIHINSNSIPEVITQDDIIEFKLSPDTSGPCSISDPKKLILRTSGRLKVAQLKRFLKMKLNLSANPIVVEILCNGDPLGDELSLMFIHKTRWPRDEIPFILTYRVNGNKSKQGL